MANATPSSHSTHSMPFGTTVHPDGSVTFSFYGSSVDHVQLVLDGCAKPLPMERTPDGWHHLTTALAHVGSRYRFQLPDGLLVPDPGSRFQPEDLAGPSQVIDPAAYTWNDAAWRGRPWHEAALYELHVGTFTPEGTFRAAIQRLDHLVALGITGVEVMCVADFQGRWNWGYDPVLLFAPDSAYGTPDDLKAFVDAAHGRGLQVIFDVVYNHFGPQGNYLASYFPEICSSHQDTPWGNGLNFDGPGNRIARDLILHNALYWIEEFHADGLRLDATHTMLDTSTPHILDELAARVADLAPYRTLHLIVEHEENIPHKIGRNLHGEILALTAQWNYDLPRLLTAVFGNFCETGLEHITQQTVWAIAQGYVVPRHEHKDVPRDVYFAPPTSYVAFLQTHDLVGNRILGDRMSVHAGPEIIRALTAILLLMPQIPLLFMGQEWGSTTPFPFFSDYTGELGENMRSSRRQQFSQIIPEPSEAEKDQAPDPQHESTFRSAQLRWDDLADPAHARWLDFHTQLLKVRHQRLMPHLAGLAYDNSSYELIAPGAFTINWQLDENVILHLAANLCNQPRDGIQPLPGDLLWQEGDFSSDTTLGPWSVRWSIEAPLPCAPGNLVRD